MGKRRPLVGYLYRNRAFTGLILKLGRLPVKRPGRLCLAPVFEPLGRCCPPARPSCWACRKVVLGAPGPFGHRPYCSSCSPAAGWSALGRFQLGDNLSLRPPKGWSNGSCPLPRMACHFPSRHGPCEQCEVRARITGLHTRQACLTF
jgi:hypothetical protein